jgi:hypothetical protein
MAATLGTDPCRFNTWKIAETSSGWSPQTTILKSGALKYMYTCHSIAERDSLKETLHLDCDAQLELAKNLPFSDKASVWTWYAPAPPP